MIKKTKFINDYNGDILIEATILLPIIIMIFAALVLLSVYLPVRITLDQATQYAASALSSELSDTWLNYDDKSMQYVWVEDKEDLKNVYVALFDSNVLNHQSRADQIVRKIEEKSISSKSGTLKVEYNLNNYILYKEVIVSATRIIPLPVDLSFIKFPKDIVIRSSSTAIVQNGDEFIRNVDIAVDIGSFLVEKYQLDKIFDSVSQLRDKFKSFKGW